MSSLHEEPAPRGGRTRPLTAAGGRVSPALLQSSWCVISGPDMTWGLPVRGWGSLVAPAPSPPTCHVLPGLSHRLRIPVPTSFCVDGDRACSRPKVTGFPLPPGRPEPRGASGSVPGDEAEEAAPRPRPGAPAVSRPLAPLHFLPVPGTAPPRRPLALANPSLPSLSARLRAPHHAPETLPSALCRGPRGHASVPGQHWRWDVVFPLRPSHRLSFQERRQAGSRQSAGSTPLDILLGDTCMNGLGRGPGCASP